MWFGRGYGQAKRCGDVGFGWKRRSWPRSYGREKSNLDIQITLGDAITVGLLYGSPAGGPGTAVTEAGTGTVTAAAAQAE